MESNGLWEEDHRRVKRLGRREDTCCRHFMLEEVDPSSGKTYLQLIQEKLVELQQMQTICEKSYLRTHYVNAYSNMTKSNEISLPDLREENYLCLHCSFCGVLECTLSSKERNNFMKHFIYKDHFLAILIRKQVIYCAKCRDYVYIEGFPRLGDTAEFQYQQSNQKKRKRKLKSQTPKPWFEWDESKYFPSFTLTSCLNRMYRTPCKGIINLGNTCFMNAILQVLLHNPLIRSFFLSESHSRSMCKMSRKKINHEVTIEQSCLGCDLASLMYQAFIPTREQEEEIAIVPHQILLNMWKYAQHLASYAQHDAHEFFISIIGGIHSNTHTKGFLGGVSPRIGTKGRSLCDCIIHQTFAGVLRSDVTCTTCSHVSHAYDPIFDVSLPLESSNRSKEKSLSLVDLLDRFTHKEILQGREQIHCIKCEAYRDSSKKLTFFGLPNVLCFHLKRFDHLKEKKIGTYVSFPSTRLIMDSYISPPITPNTTGSISQFSAIKQKSIGLETTKEPSILYDLYAVVNHHGEMNTGHYTAYIRTSETTWYLFDDAKVSLVKEKEVLESQAYLLLYISRNLKLNKPSKQAIFYSNMRETKEEDLGLPSPPPPPPIEAPVTEDSTNGSPPPPPPPPPSNPPPLLPPSSSSSYHMY